MGGFGDLIVYDDHENVGRQPDGSDAFREECGGGQRMPDKQNFNAVIETENGSKGGDGMKDVSKVVRRLTPL